MLITERYQFNDVLEKSEFICGKRSVLVRSKPLESPGWIILKAEWIRSGIITYKEGFSGVVVPVEPTTGQWMFGKRVEPIEAFNPIPIKSGKRSEFQLVTACKTIEMWCHDKEFRGSLYPAHIHAEEELQFPVAGLEHFIYLLNGQAIWHDRESSQKMLLEMNQLIRFSRSVENQEHLNLKLVGKAPRSTLIWGVIHRLANY